MTLQINGEERTLLEAANVAELVSVLELPGPTLLIEHNGVALRRDQWAACGLADQDRLEIIRIVAGG